MSRLIIEASTPLCLLQDAGRFGVRHLGVTQGGALVVCGDAQPTTPTQPTGDAWRYCSNLGSPEAARALVQATLTASGTIRFALTQTGDAASFATVPDWRTVQRELLHALHVAGHPAGRA